MAYHATKQSLAPQAANGVVVRGGGPAESHHNITEQQDRHGGGSGRSIIDVVNLYTAVSHLFIVVKRQKHTANT